MNCNKNYLQHQGQKQSCMQGTQLIEIQHGSKIHLCLLMFLKQFQVNQVKEKGRYNRCEAWPYFNFKYSSYLHKMEFCIIKLIILAATFLFSNKKLNNFLNQKQERSEKYECTDKYPPITGSSLSRTLIS